MSKLVITVASNPVAKEYLERSVQEGVPLSTITAHPAAEPIAAALTGHAPDGRVRMWGSVPGAGERHRATWARIEPGDWIVFAIDGRFRLAARIYAVLESADVADSVWAPDPEAGSYRYLTFFDSLVPIDISAGAMSAALGYGSGYIYRGFLVPSDEAQAELIAKHGSVEGFLGVLAAERAAVAALAGEAVGSGYVSDLAGFDTDAAEQRLEDSLRNHLKTDAPETVEARVRRVKRDRRLVQMLKELYTGQCQRCGFTFAKKDGTFYAEAAHITRIADRLPGIDSPDNLVILCANCHRMLDYGTLEIYWDDAALAPVSRLDGDPVPLALNKHIKMSWAPAEAWAVATESDAEWEA